MYSVLVADDNNHWRKILCAAINEDEMFDVVSNACNGKDAIEKIIDFLPDIIILDIVMPDYDGISIVEYISNKIPDYFPIIYVISGMGTSTIVDMMNSFDINFYSLKPIAIDIVIANLKRLVARYNNKGHDNSSVKQALSTEELITDTLRRLGLLPHLQSTKCAKEALIAYMNVPSDTRMLTKVIYPCLAKSNRITSSAVEKNIRKAIKYITVHRSDMFTEIFGFYANKKITNSLFLSAIADYIGKI